MTNPLHTLHVLARWWRLVRHRIRSRWFAWLVKRAIAANQRDQRALDKKLQRRTRIARTSADSWQVGREFEKR